MQNIKLVKLVSGETILANHEDGLYKDPVIVQTIPSPSGAIQLALLPYGFPFEQEISGSIDEKHALYSYEQMPEELKNKYVEAKSNIKIASGPLGGSSSDSGIIL